MTDLDKVKKLFDHLEVEFKTSSDETQTILLLEVGSEKINGYGGFCCDYIFDKDGKFIEIGIFE